MIPNFLMADVKLYSFRFPTGKKKEDLTWGHFGPGSLQPHPLLLVNWQHILPPFSRSSHRCWLPPPEEEHTTKAYETVLKCNRWICFLTGQCCASILVVEHLFGDVVCVWAYSEACRLSRNNELDVSWYSVLTDTRLHPDLTEFITRLQQTRQNEYIFARVPTTNHNG